MQNQASIQRKPSLLKKCLAAGALLLAGTTMLAPVADARDYPNPYNNPYTNRSNNSYYNLNSNAVPPYARDRSMYDGSAWWRRDVVGGASYIKIDLSEQRAYFYKGGRLAGVSPVSTGMAGHRTPTGNFRISEKEINHESTLYGHYVDRRGYVLRSNVDVRRDRRPPGAVFRGASMDFMMRVNGAVTMHAGRVPGYPASHGCIRLPWHMAKIFFANARVGTKVSVVP
ncbi:L,D-transpeptidase family protein [Microbulbifer sp. SAOS-129_SWC]|uniref:L,D-transpeptidase family protein n=1 Tax=Microbulbifer sp. SAOS-129_SWC TaxID=3145235 RepID=UPI0032163097